MGAATYWEPTSACITIVAIIENYQNISCTSVGYCKCFCVRVHIYAINACSAYFYFPQNIYVPLVGNKADDRTVPTTDTSDASDSMNVVGHGLRKIIVDDQLSLECTREILIVMRLKRDVSIMRNWSSSRLPQCTKGKHIVYKYSQFIR